MRDVARYYRNNLLDESKGKEAMRVTCKPRSSTTKRQNATDSGFRSTTRAWWDICAAKATNSPTFSNAGLLQARSVLPTLLQTGIIVPIMDGMSNVIAFGGRIYHGEKDVAKYKNSTNTALFDKGRTVYGINFVKRDKKLNGASYKNLILVEGYMDVISLGAAGVKNAVAGMGTALTEGQAREISRLTDTVFVCYDGDGAGAQSVREKHGYTRKVRAERQSVSLPDGKDPDETVRSEGYDGFMKYVDCALPLMEYKLKLCADANDLNTVNGRAKYVSQALAVLKDVENVAEREVYLGVVSELSGVGVQTLSQQVGAPVLRKSEPRKENAEEKEGKIMRASRFVVKLRC